MRSANRRTPHDLDTLPAAAPPALAAWCLFITLYYTILSIVRQERGGRRDRLRGAARHPSGCPAPRRERDLAAALDQFGGAPPRAHRRQAGAALPARRPAGPPRARAGAPRCAPGRSTGVGPPRIPGRREAGGTRDPSLRPLDGRAGPRRTGARLVGGISAGGGLLFRGRPAAGAAPPHGGAGSPGAGARPPHQGAPAGPLRARTLGTGAARLLRSRAHPGAP